MSAANVAAIAAVLNQRFDDDLTSNINRSTPVFQILPVKKANSPVLQWAEKFGTAATPATAALADGAAVVTFNSDTKVPALLDYTTYHDAFGVTGMAVAKAAAAGNPQQIANLFEEEMRESIPRLAMAVAQDIYSGPGTGNRMLGITATAGGTRAAGTYAGINRGTFTQWSGNELANGGILRPLSIALMRRMRTTIYVASGLKPDFILCSPAIFEVYGNLLGDKRRYMEDVTLRGRKIVLDGGYQVLEFDGIPLIEDVSCPDAMIFGNSRYMDVFQLPSPEDAINRAMGQVELKGTEETQYGETNTKLTARCQPLQIGGDLYNFANYCYPQVRVKRPQATGFLTDLQT
jgi:hypothetical protein